MGRVVDMQEQRKSENNEATFDLLTCNVLTMLDIEAVSVDSLKVPGNRKH